MPETVLAALSNIRTTEEMIVAFRDEEHCRRLLESHGVAGWENLPRLWLQTLDRDSRPRYGQAACAAGSLSMLQWQLPVPVHGDDAHAFALHEASLACLAEGHVADAAVG